MTGDVTADAVTAADSRPFLTVGMRTRGDRESIVDALTSLAAQTDPDFEVRLVVHAVDAGTDPGAPARIDELARSFDPGFSRRIHVRRVVGGGRGRPLSVALADAAGAYFAILDDDDVVTSDWVAVFRELARRSPGSMLRAASVVQWFERRYGALAEFEAVSGFEAPYPSRFDLLDTIRSNRSPACSYAVPVDRAREVGLDIDDEQRVCEDWKFELDAARRFGVVSAPVVTSIYRRWTGTGSTSSADDEAVWIADHERAIDTLDASPTTLPPGSLRRIHDLYVLAERLETELGRRRPTDPPLRLDPARPGAAE
jgi:glycosyltransferase involved in cell wall biosynthesis